MINVLHSGKLGDAICGLKACQKIAERHNDKIKFYIREDFYDGLHELIACQPMIAEVEKFGRITDNDYNAMAIDYNLDNFRSINPWQNHVILCHLIGMNLGNEGWNEPWLTVPEKRSPDSLPFAFIHRSWRYRNPATDWKKYVAMFREQVGDEIYFFGLESEYNNFKTIDPNIKYVQTKNILELAEYLNCADIVAVNQTVSDALCWGMGKAHWLEKSQTHDVTVLIQREEEKIMI